MVARFVRRSKAVQVVLLFLGASLLPLLGTAQATTAPAPLGMQVSAISSLKAAGAPPAYGSYWVGAWMATSGWGGFDSALTTAASNGVIPIVYWYYWGDSISPTCIENGCNGRSQAQWTSLTQQLADHVSSKMAGRETLIVLENEFNKNGITGTYAPTFDAKLESVAKTLTAVPGVKLVLGFGNWGESSWTLFPKSAAQCEYIGFQMMRASTRDTETSYRAAADRTLYLTNYVAAKFAKPSFLYDLALSSYPDDYWANVQKETLAAIFNGLTTSGATGLQGIIYRSYADNYMDPANYYGLAESHWGLHNSDGSAKPAWSVWMGVATPAPPVNAAPTATFTSNATDLSASFDASASRDPEGAALAYAWSFGDGSAGTGVAASHAYAAAGSYTVTLTVSDGVNTANATGTVVATAPNAPPTASFSLRASDLSVAVDASNSSDPNGDALTYAWSFGDGAAASGRTATHAYASAGNYTVALNVSDGRASATTSQSARATLPNQAPTAQMSMAVQGLVGTFNASASTDPEGAPLSYSWTFGDGATSNGATPRHAYAAPGNYTVSVTVSDGSLASSKTSILNVPVQPPLASFSTSGGGSVYAFNASASASRVSSALSYAWDFGDGAKGSGMISTHTYAAPGTYRVTLTVSDAGGAASANATLGATAYAATFSPTSGNNYWVQVGVSSNEKTTSVCASVNGGACQALANKTYGWAASFYVPTNAKVVFTATSESGKSVTSVAYSWPTGAPYVAPFTATFTPYGGNNYWVQTLVNSTSTVKSVCASVNGGACQALAFKSWGAWAASFYVPTGAKVVFTAVATDGQKATSASYTWPK